LLGCDRRRFFFFPLFFAVEVVRRLTCSSPPFIFFPFSSPALVTGSPPLPWNTKHEPCFPFLVSSWRRFEVPLSFFFFFPSGPPPPLLIFRFGGKRRSPVPSPLNLEVSFFFLFPFLPSLFFLGFWDVREKWSALHFFFFFFPPLA